MIFNLCVSLEYSYLVMHFVFSFSISGFSNKAIPRTYQSPLVLRGRGRSVVDLIALVDLATSLTW